MRRWPSAVLIAVELAAVVHVGLQRFEQRLHVRVVIHPSRSIHAALEARSLLAVLHTDKHHKRNGVLANRPVTCQHPVVGKKRLVD